MILDELDIKISDIKYDSRKVKSGDLFVAISGHQTDGEKYIQDAIKNGAVAIASEELHSEFNIPQIKIENSRRFLAQKSADFYHYPSQKLYLSGVTGTNGKTTISHLLHHIWKDQNINSGLISTIDIQYKDHQIQNTHTTPESYEIQKTLNDMIYESVSHAVMEVSSHGLSQSRVESLDFDSCIFTNLTQDHLDYHKNMDDYYHSKLKLFTNYLSHSSKKNKLAIINQDDVWGLKILKELDEQSYQTYGHDHQSDCQILKADISLDGITAKIKFQDQIIDITSPMVGDYNLSNILAVFLAAVHGGLEIDSILESLKTFPGVSGRLEKISSSNDVQVFVDYAHTPDALKNVLKTLRGLTSGKIITVFGCGGDRDRSKRSLMGREAAQYSDLCIITSDNPRSEDPQKIIDDILVGIQKENKDHLIIADRKSAIEEALNRASPKDVILIAGKGHEDYQIIGNQKKYFSDQKVVKEYLGIS